VGQIDPLGKGGGLKILWRRPPRVRIPSPAPPGTSHLPQRERIFDIQWKMTKDGYAESTIKSTGKRLRMMNRRGVDLDNAEAMKEYLAAKLRLIHASYSPKITY
jgi:hypothetical protein